MEVLTKNIDDLVPYFQNPRIIPEEAIRQVASSLEMHGFKQPIVIDKKNVIVVGHTRVLAAKQIGYQEVPCVIYEGDKDKIDAYRIADNKTGEFTSWEESFLDEELNRLIQKGVDVAGFYDTEGLAPEFLDINDETIQMEEVGYNAKDLTNLVPLMFYLSQKERKEVMDILEKYRDENNLDTKNQALVALLRK